MTDQATTKEERKQRLAQREELEIYRGPLLSELIFDRRLFADLDHVLPLLDEMGKALAETPVAPSDDNVFLALGSPIRWMTRYREWRKTAADLVSRYRGKR